MHEALPLDRHGESGQFLYAPACRQFEPQMVGSDPRRAESPGAIPLRPNVSLSSASGTRARAGLAPPDYLSSLFFSCRPPPRAATAAVAHPRMQASCVPREFSTPEAAGLAYLEHVPFLQIARHSLVFPTAYLERAHGTAGPVRLCPIPPCVVRTEIPPRSLFCTSLLLPNLAGVPRDPVLRQTVARARRTEGIEGIASRPPPIQSPHGPRPHRPLWRVDRDTDTSSSRPLAPPALAPSPPPSASPWNSSSPPCAPRFRYDAPDVAVLDVDGPRPFPGIRHLSLTPISPRHDRVRMRVPLPPNLTASEREVIMPVVHHSSPPPYLFALFSACI
ncbi:hypothetical protein B0H14DRAFT_3484356 [Mycena olivaceomarginata]|nr:hypothetical protein B0H14DRAFT_3484356 [Mycena olivaceomarginata]